jgi:uncharacterized protein YceK
MKADVGKWVVVVLLGILASGCSSIRARTETLHQGWMVYPGVRQDIKELDEVFSGERPESAWVNGLVASMLVLDLPFSTVFDTFVLPYDLNRVYTRKASGDTRESSDAPRAGTPKSKEPEER